MSALVSDAKALLRQTLPPRYFNFAKTRWWWLYHYTFPSIRSWFIKSTPKVHSFYSGGGSYIEERVRNVNVVAPTKMCRVMASQGSDKALFRHNYTTIYSALLKDRQNETLRIFELGLGSANPDMPFNMAFLGYPGASLRAWKKIFPSGVIYGADIDRSILFQEDRIKTFYCDQLDPASIRDLWMQPELQDGMDIIIDDAYHTFDANVSFLENSLDRLRPGGLYIVEDIELKCFDGWFKKIELSYSRRYPAFEFVLLNLPNAFQPTLNNLLLIRRSAN
jgi:hypothetical protein